MCFEKTAQDYSTNPYPTEWGEKTSLCGSGLRCERSSFFLPKPLTLSQLTLTSGNFMSKHFKLWENAKTLSCQSKYNRTGRMV